MKVFNFKGPTHNTEFGTYCGRTVFHLLKKPVGNQYLDVLRIFVPTEVLIPLEILRNLRGTTYVQGNIFPDPTHKKGPGPVSYDLVTIFNFLEKLAQNKYMSRILEY